VTAGFGPPVAVHHRVDDPSSPLVVLLHGRGSDETQIIGLADQQPFDAGVPVEGGRLAGVPVRVLVAQAGSEPSSGPPPKPISLPSGSR
jgi:hypothetical protein